MIPFSELRGKRAVVTGGAKGIGRDIALTLAEWGAEVVVMGRDAAALERTLRELRELQPRCRALPCDIRDVSAVRETMDQAAAAMGGIDLLVNNAGINIAKPAWEVTEADWDAVLDTNLKGVFFCSQSAGRHMAAAGGGAIVTVASQMAFVGYPNRAAYCSSKGGAVQLTRALAVEWAPWRIRVNAVAPTFVRTEMTSGMLADEAFRKDVLGRIPWGELASPRDVTGAVLFLASDLAGFVTGETVRVDGGWTAI